MNTLPNYDIWKEAAPSGDAPDEPDHMRKCEECQWDLPVAGWEYEEEMVDEEGDTGRVHEFPVWVWFITCPTCGHLNKEYDR